MAKKDKSQQKQQSSKHVTKRRLARWEREKRRQRITFLTGIAVVLVVIGVIIGGVIASSANDWLSKIQTDSGEVVIKRADYADALNLIQHGMYQSSGDTQAAPLIILENKELIRDGASEAGLSVSDTEIDSAIRAIFETGNESITDDEFEEAYQQALDDIVISNEKFREIIEDSLLNEKLVDYYLEQVPESGEQAAIETIVVDNSSTADELAERWRGGEDFEALSAEYGNISESGWVALGAMEEDIANAASTIEIGNVSDPISMTSETTSYYYVIKVLDRTDGPIAEELQQEWGTKDYLEWYQDARGTRVERNDGVDLDEVYSWALEQIS
ncbi:MAG: SurA N-terminal domain-containing protein [Chloroflexota bacterium]|nr:SurA N-terminal domain-containing protein [Chloroflexota bacterium]